MKTENLRLDEPEFITSIASGILFALFELMTAVSPDSDSLLLIDRMLFPVVFGTAELFQFAFDFFNCLKLFLIHRQIKLLAVEDTDYDDIFFPV